MRKRVSERRGHVIIVAGGELDFLMQYSVFLERRGLAPGWKTWCFSGLGVPESTDYWDRERIRCGTWLVRVFATANFRSEKLAYVGAHFYRNRLMRGLAELCEFSKNGRSCNGVWKERIIDVNGFKGYPFHSTDH